MVIKKSVRKLIDVHGTNNPFKIASRKNIFVLFEQLGDILGYFNTYKRIRFIHINNELDETTQRFTCAHELGHAVLHPKVNTPFLKKNTLFSVDKIEREANQFAVELLMPDESICEYLDMNITLQAAAAIHGVPEQLAYLKRVANLTRK